MNALAPIAPRLAKLIPRLDVSNHDGDRLASLNVIDRTLKAAGTDWHALADAVTTTENLSGWDDGPGLSTPDLIKQLLECGALSGWERTYVCDLARLVYQRQGLSPRQMAKLREIYAQRIGGAA